MLNNYLQLPMKNKLLFQEIIVACALVVLVLAFLDPFMLWMPSKLSMVLFLLAVVVFMIFAVFVWREQAQDEREVYNRLQASRIAWLTGAGILLVGLIVQGFAYAVDPWLVAALAGMIIAKSITRIISIYK